MTFVAGILIASVLGSVHCAAMCGPFACAWALHGSGRGRLKGHMAYHGGRLMSYVSLGALAGAIGTGVDRLGGLAGIGRLAAIVAGIAMVTWAATTIGASFGLPIGRVAGGSGREVAVGALAIGAVLRRFDDAPIWLRAGSLGLLTTLIPCGWLYAFVATAGATAHTLSGAAVMGVFWVGTVPALIAVTAGATRLLGPFSRRLPVASAVVVLVFGLLAISGRAVPAFMPGQAHGASHR